MKIVHNKDIKQITFLDERFYTRDDKSFFPSSTTILDVWPKGYGYIAWLKSFGVDADRVLDEAGRQGTKIHDAIDEYIKYNEVRWADDVGKAIYTAPEWMMIMRFRDFWKTYKPTVLAHEFSMLSEKLGFGGTLDLVCEIKNVPGFEGIWLIDYKSSNGVYKSHELQIASYSMLWNEIEPKRKIQKTGIMWLKSKTRGPDKTLKQLQGDGWSLKEPERPYEEGYKYFEYAKAIWYDENRNYKPKNLIYPDRINREDDEK